MGLFSRKRPAPPPPPPKDPALESAVNEIHKIVREANERVDQMLERLKEREAHNDKGST